MKKLFLIFTFIGITVAQISAQSSNGEADAKVSYLLAEDEFGAGKYESCLSLLSEAANKLGKANSKILFLKIMAERELSLQDKSYQEKLVKTIAAFEKAPDVKSFNQEKYLEVMKLKLLLQKEEAQAQREREALAEKANEAIKAFKEFSRKGWELGASVEAVKKTQPGFFAKAEKTQGQEGEVYSTISDMESASQNGVKMVYVKNNIVYGLYDALFLYEEDASFSKSTASVKNTVLSSLTERFGFPPVERTEDSSTKGTKSTTKYYTWEKNGKKIEVVLNHSSFSKKSHYGSAGMQIMDNTLIK